MGASFVSASSQYLTNSETPITGSPFTVGMWVRPTALDVSTTLWSLSDTAASLDYWAIEQNGFNAFRFLVDSPGGSGAATGASSSVVANSWHFMIARQISAANRRFSVLSPSGLIDHKQDTTSATPAGIDAMTLGAKRRSAVSEYWAGQIAEFWIANADIQADGAQLRDSTLWQIALGGVFSVPHIAKNIIEYRSLRVIGQTRGDQMGEFYHGSAGRQTWTNINGVTTSRHPPLPYWYRKPSEPPSRIARVPRGAITLEEPPPPPPLPLRIVTTGMVW